jgi:hypothetical protein
MKSRGNGKEKPRGHHLASYAAKGEGGSGTTDELYTEGSPEVKEIVVCVTCKGIPPEDRDGKIVWLKCGQCIPAVHACSEVCAEEHDAFAHPRIIHQDELRGRIDLTII